MKCSFCDRHTHSGNVDAQGRPWCGCDKLSLWNALRARATDPDTSREAARAAKDKISPSMDWVSRVMRDGTPRIDEEIHIAAVSMGCPLGPTRTRHGRNDLVKLGRIEATGKKRRTSTNTNSKEWVWCGC